VYGGEIPLEGAPERPDVERGDGGLEKKVRLRPKIRGIREREEGATERLPDRRDKGM